MKPVFIVDEAKRKQGTETQGFVKAEHVMFKTSTSF